MRRMFRQQLYTNSLSTSNGKKAPPVHAGLSGAPARPTPFRHAPRRQQRAPSRRKRRPAAPGKSTKQNIRPSGPFGLPLETLCVSFGFPLCFLCVSSVFPLGFFRCSFRLAQKLYRWPEAPNSPPHRRGGGASPSSPARGAATPPRSPAMASGDVWRPGSAFGGFLDFGFWVLWSGGCERFGVESAGSCQAAAEAAKGVGLFWMSGGRARAVVSGRNPASISPRRKKPTCAKCEDPKWTALK